MQKEVDWQIGNPVVKIVEGLYGLKVLSPAVGDCSVFLVTEEGVVPTSCRMWAPAMTYR
jgi:hypothetical protein